MACRTSDPPWDPKSAGFDAHRRVYVGLIGLVLVLVAGTVGYVAFGYGVLDAVFQTVITVSTVGFGEGPLRPGEKVFTIVLILVGVGTAAYTFTVAIETLVEGYLGGDIPEAQDGTARSGHARTT